MNKDGLVVYIGVGSNIDPKENIRKALDLLKKGSEVRVTGISSFYSTTPVNRTNQDSYLNGIFETRTDITAEEFKTRILSPIEKELKRERKRDRFASRTIDLDILLYGDLCIEDMGIPDQDIYTRNFVAVPLRELDSQLVLPDSGMKIADLSLSEEIESMQFEKVFTDELRERIIDE